MFVRGGVGLRFTGLWTGRPWHCESAMCLEKHPELVTQRAHFIYILEEIVILFLRKEA